MFLNSTTLPTLETNKPTTAEIYAYIYDRLGTAGTAILSWAILTAADGYMAEEFQAADRGEISLGDLRDAIEVYLTTTDEGSL